MDDIGYLESYGGKSLHQQSHGESFLSLLNYKFRGNGLYLLDEPEAALSPIRQLAGMAIIHKLVKANSQFIIVTHSPIIMAYPNAWIYHLSESGIRKVKYTESEHYKVAKDFLDRPEQTLRMLLEEP
jgi:predicted ATPase